MALLARDVAEIEPTILRMAIDRHVTTSPYLPKASELHEHAQAVLARTITGNIDWVEQGNRQLMQMGRHDIRWRRDESGDLVLGPAA